MIGAPPFPGAGVLDFAQFAASAYNNIFPTNGTTQMVYSTGSAFAVATSSPHFALTALACKLTYSGPPAFYSVRIYAGMLVHLCNVTSFGFLGMDLNGDLLAFDTTAANPVPFLVTDTFDPLAEFPQAMAIERIVGLTAGDVLRPVFGALTGAGVDIGVDSGTDTFNVVVSQLGLL